jgi:hypothetical protein
MKTTKKSFPERLAALELLANETGLLDELETRQRSETDKRRIALAAQLKALPKPERELAALSKNAERTVAHFKSVETAYHEAERAMKEARTRVAIATLAFEGEKQRILTELARNTPLELTEALDDLTFADTLLRAACRTDVTTGKNWLGQKVRAVHSNLTANASARKKLSDAEVTIRKLMHDGEIPSDALVNRCAEIVDAAMESAYEFIPRSLWDLRRSKPSADIVAEVTGYI